MNEYSRKLCVSELNRILPMVRETIRKEQEYRKLVHSDIDERKTELEKVDNILHMFTEVPLLLSDAEESSEAMKQLETLNKKLESRKEELEILIKDYDQKLSKVIDELRLENRLYEHILLFIVSYAKDNSRYDMGGILEKNELQEDFLKEYIYLLILTDSRQHIILTMKDHLFKDLETETAFRDMVNKKYNQEQAKCILRAIDNRHSPKDLLSLFFDIFK